MVFLIWHRSNQCLLHRNIQFVAIDINGSISTIDYNRFASCYWQLYFNWLFKSKSFNFYCPGEFRGNHYPFATTVYETMGLDVTYLPEYRYSSVVIAFSRWSDMVFPSMYGDCRLILLYCLWYQLLIASVYQ